MAARSTHVTLENKAGRFNLRLKNAGLDDGVWKIQPPQIIGDRGEWESESDGFLTGTEGRVAYALEDVDGNHLGDLALHWNNPFVGSNSYDECLTAGAGRHGQWLLDRTCRWRRRQCDRQVRPNERFLPG